MPGSKTGAGRMLISWEAGAGSVRPWGNCHHQPQIRAARNWSPGTAADPGPIWRLQRETICTIGDDATWLQGHLPLWDSKLSGALSSSSRVSFISGHLMTELSLESHLLFPWLNSFIKIILLDPDYICEVIRFITNRWTERPTEGPVGLLVRVPTQHVKKYILGNR